MRKATYKAELFQDIDRATNIARILYDQFYNQKGIFREYSMPEYVLPFYENIITLDVFQVC